MAEARICVQLDASGADGPVAAQIGGLPVLPEDVPWPVGSAGQALPFVASIDCVKVPRDGVDVVLPESGTLLFFLDYEHVFWDEEEQENMKVLHVPSGAAERAVPSGDDGEPVVTAYTKTGLRPSLRRSVGEDDEDAEDGESTVDWPDRETMIVGGHSFTAHWSAESKVVDELQDALSEEDVLRDWRPLAQFGLPDPMHNYCNARFMISKEDLAAGRFDRVISSAEFTE